MKTAEEYRARVIQLEALVARIAMVVELPRDTQRLADYVLHTSIASTEDFDPVSRCNVPWQKVTPLEDIVLVSRTISKEER